MAPEKIATSVSQANIDEGNLIEFAKQHEGLIRDIASNLGTQTNETASSGSSIPPNVDTTGTADENSQDLSS